jgi:hypothetical protein
MGMDNGEVEWIKGRNESRQRVFLLSDADPHRDADPTHSALAVLLRTAATSHDERADRARPHQPGQSGSVRLDIGPATGWRNSSRFLGGSIRTFAGSEDVHRSIYFPKDYAYLLAPSWK